MSPYSKAIDVVSILLVASAAAFAIGVAIERSLHHESAGEAPAARAAETVTASSVEAGSETGAEGAPATTTAVPAAEPAGHADAGEKLLGVSTESTGLVALAVVLSLLLAAVLRRRRGRAILLVAAGLLGLVFAAFDVREAVHQADLSESGLVVLAVVVAVLHVGVLAAAAWALASRRGAARAAG